MRPSNLLTSIVPIMVAIPVIIAVPTVEVIKRGRNALEPRVSIDGYTVKCDTEKNEVECAASVAGVATICLGAIVQLLADPFVDVLCEGVVVTISSRVAVAAAILSTSD
ncbi:hypothetical protein OIDMADRAFT_21812 [Oidiodendron maius Zn]|uniref:Uncharacterized protein n=1 Tax=Oidiodendron maius (strain Zn) TaxID=913774 RepID=A0A0C3HXB5_OIDMZ|nr:hypothetical protein OIDMADRAFT_21812 [Oidiodendron maius Zn]